MSEEPTVRSDEELLEDLIKEAGQQLEEAERKLAELDEKHRKATMIHLIEKQANDEIEILLPEEKRLLEADQLNEAQGRVNLWRRRLRLLRREQGSQEYLKKMKH
jgi:hypothetical protein